MLLYIVWVIMLLYIVCSYYLSKGSIVILLEPLYCPLDVCLYILWFACSRLRQKHEQPFYKLLPFALAMNYNIFSLLNSYGSLGYPRSSGFNSPTWLYLNFFEYVFGVRPCAKPFGLACEGYVRRFKYSYWALSYQLKLLGLLVTGMVSEHWLSQKS